MGVRCVCVGWGNAHHIGIYCLDFLCFQGQSYVRLRDMWWVAHGARKCKADTETELQVIPFNLGYVRGG